MVPNLPRKLFAIAALAIGSIFSLLYFQVELGLDLAGGSRLVYKIDFEKAVELGDLTETEALVENRQPILSEMVTIFGDRVTGSGLREIPVASQGDDRIVVEMPRATQEEVERIKIILKSQGRLAFRIVADPNEDPDLNITQEIEKFRTWRTANPDPIANETIEFNRLAEADGGPRPGILWFDIGEKALDDPEGGVARIDPNLDAIPVRVEDTLRPPVAIEDSRNFGGDDLGPVGPGFDNAGLPAVNFTMREDRKAAFQSFTGEYKDRRMAIVLNDKVMSAPVIQSELPGGGIITGGARGFSNTDMRDLIVVLRTGSLKIRPELESEISVGPSLGADSIRTGALSALIGGIAVLIFMLFYYRMNGVVATMALLFNGFILLGALSFTQATLTLPGLAGLVLTIGMAVDANILIFERVREERKRGREVPQAYKNGFERAFTTIVDANLTTLITALILMQVGTGPVRGFAATLSLGVLTSMFSALVFSKVILSLMVFGKDAKIKEVNMAARLLGDAKFAFLSKRKPAAILSIVLILGGMTVFATSGSNIYGIDFTGGEVAHVQLKEPMSIGEFRGLVSGQGQNYTVTQLGSETETTSSDASDNFLVKVKLTDEQRVAKLAEGGSAEAGEEVLLIASLRSVLGDRLHATAPFPESSTVGPRVVDEIRDKAIMAMFLSLIAIVIYMNFRFKEYRYGIAAVVALLHDVLFSLGALAVFAQLGIVQVEINLEIIAAFLTIIGYSLNDTIVVFDRIRENLPRRKGSFTEIIDLSINQSLSRTILTSITTFFVVAVLFFMNLPYHNVLEGFAFAMLIGVVVGTYSSMFVASPMLVFLDRWARHKLIGDEADSSRKAKKAEAIKAVGA